LRERLSRRTLDGMISRLAALGAVVLAAATTLASTAQGAGEDVRMDVISVTPRPPQAAQVFELVARVEFAPAPGSIHCAVWAGGKRYRNIRLTWGSSIARCFFRVPADARGKRLTVGLIAAQGGSRARTSLTFIVS
jgi:predicted small secreted protein